jgi:hypothetical protein
VGPTDGGAFEDKTSDIEWCRADPDAVHIKYLRNKQIYRYGRRRVAILRDPVALALDAGERVEIRGSVWRTVTEVLVFGAWCRIFYRTEEGGDYRTYPFQDVRILRDATSAPGAAGVLAYWRSIASALPEDDRLRDAYSKLTFVHPESALGRYLNAEPIADTGMAAPAIFPFSGNLSQRQAVERALRHTISVVEGPPGTGKTQTILNLIANIVSARPAARPATVAVVSSNNAAVDNVRDKLADEGFGYVAASLGRLEKRMDFLTAQAQEGRNAEVDRLVGDAKVVVPPPEQLADLDRRLQQLRQGERRLAEWHQEIDSYRLEQRHFSRYLERHELPDLAHFPLLRRSSGRILDYLAETATRTGRAGRIRQLIRRVRFYLRYGPTGGVDPEDTDVVLALQRAYYDRKIAELQRQIEHAEDELGRADFDGLAGDHQRLSAQALRSALQQRYATLKRTVYKQESYRLGSNFSTFTMDYPVILSTCHSLARSIAGGFLLDYLIIDEASQVDLLAAGLALACARTVVIVGDGRQLPSIPNETAAASAGPAPAAAYDYQQHSILSSVMELYGPALPRTMLREHYRCDPAIIGFCNKKFYDGQLVPYTKSSPGSRPLIVVRTVEGNHMRQHRGGGRSNQREVDVIVEDVHPAPGGEPVEQLTPHRPLRRLHDAFAGHRYVPADCVALQALEAKSHLAGERPPPPGPERGHQIRVRLPTAVGQRRSTSERRDAVRQSPAFRNLRLHRREPPVLGLRLGEGEGGHPVAVLEREADPEVALRRHADRRASQSAQELASPATVSSLATMSFAGWSGVSRSPEHRRMNDGSPRPATAVSVGWRSRRPRGRDHTSCAGRVGQVDHGGRGRARHRSSVAVAGSASPSRRTSCRGRSPAGRRGLGLGPPEG